jgi:hypothetical protein
MTKRTFKIQIKRIYDPPGAADGTRVLVDRLWPRGVSKQRAKTALWLKEIAPSPALRKWFDHDPARWEELAVAIEPNSPPMKRPSRVCVIFSNMARSPCFMQHVTRSITMRWCWPGSCGAGNAAQVQFRPTLEHFCTVCYHL